MGARGGAALLALGAALTIGAVPTAFAEDTAPDNLADFSLEELGNIEVTSVSKRAERLADAPASVFVITADDIRRSGATSLPEALRLAPNLEVARVSANAYAISSRGFNNGIGNKLQVLLDGRILYTPLFSGVFWDTPDVMLEDVERIEVLSGPGATLWGANAVNGVINIITRRATDTQGGLVSASASDLGRNYALRFGGGIGSGAYRVYGKFFERDDSERANGANQNDSWHRGEIGFRADWGTATDGVTLQGATYRGDLDTATPDDLEISGTNILGRWTRELASGGSTQLQAYFDRNDRDIPTSIRQRLKVYDVEFQHEVGGLEKNILVWGINHRTARDEVVNRPTIALLPAERDLHWTSVFVRDQYALRDDLQLIGGLRIEHNSYTGTEVMPTARLTWKATPSQLLWVSAARAVRTPSRFDRDLFAPAQPPFVIAGGSDFRSEVANVYSLGYRSQPMPRVSYSLTLSHHDYDYLRSFEQSAPGRFFIGNEMEGDGTSLEAWGAFQVTDVWRLSAGGAWLDLNLRLKPGSTDPLGQPAAGNDPEYHWILRSSLDLPAGLQLDTSVRHVAALPAPRVPAYTAVDVRLGWRPNDRFELSLTGQNLFDERHVEFGSTVAGSQIERELRVGIRWLF
ncbi:TonB-dependent receptor plug domain-containing protein [Lysobacter terrae]